MSSANFSQNEVHQASVLGAASMFISSTASVSPENGLPHTSLRIILPHLRGVFMFLLHRMSILDPEGSESLTLESLALESLSRGELGFSLPSESLFSESLLSELELNAGTP